jgi:hypothetical protein
MVDAWMQSAGGLCLFGPAALPTVSRLNRLAARGDARGAVGDDCSWWIVTRFVRRNWPGVTE